MTRQSKVSSENLEWDVAMLGNEIAMVDIIEGE